MRRKFDALLLFIILILNVTSLYAYPSSDWEIRMYPFWQDDYNSVILGCKDDDQACKSTRGDHTIAKYGCSLTAMTMLYKYYGFDVIPDENHIPIHAIDYYLTHNLNPHSFNDYLSGQYPVTLGFAAGYDFDFNKTTNNFYYYEAFLNSGMYYYRYVVPNYNMIEGRLSSACPQVR